MLGTGSAPSVAVVFPVHPVHADSMDEGRDGSDGRDANRASTDRRPNGGVPEGAGAGDPVPDDPVPGVAAAVEDRDEVVARVREHAGRVARELALLDGGDYGRASFETDRGTWTLKYEGGDVDYLRFESGGDETYVVSSKRQPEPAALAAALVDYGAFVAAFGEHVASLEGVLDDVRASFPEVASTAPIVEARDRIVDRIRTVADAMADQLNRVAETNYGTFDARVDGRRWELKWEDGRASYLRVGGSGGVYLLSQYGPPGPRDLRAHVDGVRGFVEAYNDHVAELSAELSEVTL